VFDAGAKSGSGVEAASGGAGAPGAMSQHIARTAARLFAARGYDATPVRAIAEAAGVTKPTLYYHFGSKEGLAQALLTRPTQRMLAELDAALAAGLAPIETAVRMLDVKFAFFREDPDRSRFLFALFFGPLASSLASEVAALGAAMDQRWDDAVARLARAGIIEPECEAAFAVNVRGLVVVRTIDHLYRGVELEPGLGSRLINDLLRGFGRAKGTGA
jgi:AcrR family transcriptional regulator